MKTETITVIGIDVSKGKSTVAIRQPGGIIVQRPFEVRHNTEELRTLVKVLNRIDGEKRIVMEHAGMYWRPIALTLKAAGLPSSCFADFRCAAVLFREHSSVSIEM